MIWNDILKLGVDTSTSEIVLMKSFKLCINNLNFE